MDSSILHNSLPNFMYIDDSHTFENTTAETHKHIWDINIMGESGNKISNARSNLSLMFQGIVVSTVLQNIYVTFKGHSTTVECIVPIQSPRTFTLGRFRELLKTKVKNASLFTFVSPDGSRILNSQEFATCVGDVTTSVKAVHHTFGNTIDQLHLSLVPARGKKKRRRSAKKIAKTLLKRLKLLAPKHANDLRRYVERLTVLSKSL
jgi:hypothetical protein